MGRPMPWSFVVQLVENGERVEAGVTNRPTQQLTDRTQYLKDLMESALSGQAIYHRDAAMDSNVQEGHAVYWNATTVGYSKALAATETGSTGGVMHVADSAYVAGIVITKTGTTRGDVILNGILTDFDFTNTLGAGVSLSPGPYYLSSHTAGQLTLQRAPIGVFVMTLMTSDSARINPLPKDILDSHVHYKFDLYALPAGIPNCIEAGDRQEVIFPDVDQPGWLPADDASFNGLAPVGAKFGYNLAQHPELQRVFPPIPVQYVYVEQNGVGVPEGRVVVDLNGIWWMDDCYGIAPWPPVFASCTSSSSESMEPCGDTPFFYTTGFSDLSEMTITLWFTKMVFKTDTSVVTGLHAKTGSAVKITNCDGITGASQGELWLDVDLALMEGSSDVAGDNVFKTIEGTTIHKGYVVEKIKPGSYISISASRGNSTNGYQGIATISADIPGNLGQEGGPELLTPDRVIERSYENIYYLGMPAGIDSALRGKIVLPATLVTYPYMKLYFWILAKTTGNLPDLTLTFRRLITPTIGDPIQPLPVSDTSLTDLTFPAGTTAENYRYVESDTFAVTGGDIVFFTLSRLSGDAYTGEVGILRVGYKIITSPPS